MIRKDIRIEKYAHMIYGLWWAGVSGCFRTLRAGFIVGSRMTFFSGATLLTPLAGYYGGALGSLSAYLFRIFQSYLISPQLGYKYYLVYHIPGFCAALYLSLSQSSSKGKYLIGCFLPLLCMALFISDAIGSQAWWYSLYWFIPVSITLFSFQSRFTQLLATTFIAHSVGSMVSLFTKPLSVVEWQYLVGVVWYERLLYVLGMYVVIEAVEYVSARLGILTEKAHALLGREVS